MSIPAIPDTLYKFLILLSIFLFAYSEILYNSAYENYTKVQTDYTIELKRNTSELKELNSEFDKAKANIDRMALKMKVGNPLVAADTVILSKLGVRDLQKAKALSDSTKRLLERYDQKKEQVYSNDIEEAAKETIFTAAKGNLDTITYKTNGFRAASAILFVAGFLLWIIDEYRRFEGQNLARSIEMRKNLNLPIFSFNCQSCGRQFNSMIKYGKEQNGETNYSFCSSCYKDGSFINPNLTVDEMVTNTLSQFKSSRRTKALEEKIRNLQRWRPNSYDTPNYF
jgi:hypothetical protein